MAESEYSKACDESITRDLEKGVIVDVTEQIEELGHFPASTLYVEWRDKIYQYVEV